MLVGTKAYLIVGRIRRADAIASLCFKWYTGSQMSIIPRYAVVRATRTEDGVRREGMDRRTNLWTVHYSCQYSFRERGKR